MVKIVKGIENARSALISRRNLDTGDIPAHVWERTEEAFGQPLSPPEVVELIINRVRENGDSAVRDLALRLDGVELDSLEVPSSLISEIPQQH